MKIGNVVGLMLLAVFAAAPADRFEARAESVVEVTGMGYDDIKPDRIRMSFTIGLLKKTPEEAVEAAEIIYAQVLAAFDTIGFGLDRVITSQYGVYPERDEKKRDKVIGYRAIHALRVATSDTDSIDVILNRILQIEGTKVSEISFATTKLDSIRRVALAGAVRNARADAAVMAEAAGGALGELMEMTTHYPDNPTHQHKSGWETISLRSDRIIPTPLVPENVSIRVSVLGRWKFVETKPQRAPAQ